MGSYTAKRRLYKPGRGEFTSVITDLNNNLDNLDDALRDSAVAVTFDVSNEYAKGMWVIHDGAIWRFITPHPAGTVWNPAEVETVPLTEVLREHNERIESIEGTGRMDDLRAEVIPGTVQSIVYDSDGNVDKILHTKNGATFRTDQFTFADSAVTEVRTLATGEHMTIVTNTETLEVTITYSAA